eukprot:1187725-Prorocentrum_minimum.AAC.4
MSQGPEGVQRGSRGGPDGVQMGSEGVQRGSRRVRTSLDGTVYEGCVGGLDRILPNSRGYSDRVGTKHGGGAHVLLLTHPGPPMLLDENELEKDAPPPPWFSIDMLLPIIPPIIPPMNPPNGSFAFANMLPPPPPMKGSFANMFPMPPPMKGSFANGERCGIDRTNSVRGSSWTTHGRLDWSIGPFASGRAWG